MTVQILSSGILIHCSLAALCEAGLNPEALDQETALSLARSALAPVKQTLPAYPELQLYVSEKELLIFIRSFLPEKGHFSLNMCTYS